MTEQSVFFGFSFRHHGPHAAFRGVARALQDQIMIDATPPWSRWVRDNWIEILWPLAHDHEARELMSRTGCERAVFFLGSAGVSPALFRKYVTHAGETPAPPDNVTS